jgi:hypothetical protein
MVAGEQDQACQICKSKLTRLLMAFEGTIRLTPSVCHCSLTEGVLNQGRSDVLAGRVGRRYISC